MTPTCTGWRHLLPALLLLSSSYLAAGQSGPYFNRAYRYRLNGQMTRTYFGPAVVTNSGFLTSGQLFYNSPAAQQMQLLLRWLDPQGNVVSERRYIPPAGGHYYGPLFNGLLPVTAPGGGYAMAGLRFSQRRYDAMLWRFTPAGDTLWKRILVDSTRQSVTDGMCAAPGGGWLLTGYAELAPGNGKVVGLLLRVDAQGRLRWKRRLLLPTLGYARFFASTATPDGGFVVSGLARPSTYSTRVYPYIVKVDSLGQTEWQKLLGDTTQGGVSNAIRVTGDGNYVVTHLKILRRINGRWNVSQSLISKLAPDGRELWRRAIGPQRRSCSAMSILEQADGSLVVGGQQGREDSLGVGQVAFEAFAYKLCADGDSVWYRTYRRADGPVSDNYLSGFCQAPDGGFLGTGYLSPNFPDTLGLDAWAFRLDAQGYVVAGGTAPATRCRRPPWVTGLPGGEPAAAATVLVYPNPAADGRFTLQHAGGAEVLVVDATGRAVSRGRVPPQTEAPLDLSAQPPGLYLLRLTWDDGRTFTQKLLR